MCERKIRWFWQVSIIIIIIIYLNVVGDEVQCVTWWDILEFRGSYKGVIYLIDNTTSNLLSGNLSMLDVAFEKIVAYMPDFWEILPVARCLHTTFLKINTQYYYVDLFFFT